jgi:hypothetical protein
MRCQKNLELKVSIWKFRHRLMLCERANKGANVDVSTFEANFGLFVIFCICFFIFNIIVSSVCMMKTYGLYREEFSKVLTPCLE